MIKLIFFFRLTLFIASSSIIIMTLITIIVLVSCFILCNEGKDMTFAQRSLINSMSSSSALNLIASHGWVSSTFLLFHISIYRIVASRSMLLIEFNSISNMGGQKIKVVRMSWKKSYLTNTLYVCQVTTLTNKKSLFLKKIFGMLVFETLKNKKSDFLNSNTC